MDGLESVVHGHAVPLGVCFQGPLPCRQVVNVSKCAVLGMGVVALCAASLSSEPQQGYSSRCEGPV